MAPYASAGMIFISQMPGYATINAYKSPLMLVKNPPHGSYANDMYNMKLWKSKIWHGT